MPEDSLGGIPRLWPFRASCWARWSGEKILIVWSMPETARVGSYGWPGWRLDLIDVSEGSYLV